ncbi:enoyl-CoA hydratase/isomerase family protein [Rhodococcoides kyotonense]|uniref:Enoyl-CoA hydratase/isomerase n=1 Tax=Rhodococcoides kyotonense TaxID=398843 RepID=A0A239M2G8_9NOCA|nr:enoyl-CoA hydratase/isomerase family protein [Rhodococcus kyotonensis]SNT36855.1 Enoyl-CoA hydratase/isomerase [Rhodococcus kyotonensis]
MQTTVTIVDLAEPSRHPAPLALSGCIVAVDSAPEWQLSPTAETLAYLASTCLTTTTPRDRRFVQVASLPHALDSIANRIESSPMASVICDDVLRANDGVFDTLGAIVTESLAYSTLQSGPEFARWLGLQGPRTLADPPNPVLVERSGGTLNITLNQPRRHNAFSNTVRAGLVDALTVAELDATITRIELRGNGRSFCSGGDLTEFGTLVNPVAAHFARTRYSPALMLDSARARLSTDVVAYVHGSTVGSGLEMASFCGRVVADPSTMFGLPELNLGLIPGAGGTVSVPRRIGRWRTAFLVLSGCTIDAETALSWGLVDAITSRLVK